MKKIEQTEFERMIEGMEVLSSDRRGDKVFRLDDGTILKLFRLKRLLSSALLNPYARRFVRAVAEIRKRDVPCVDVVRSFHVRGTVIDGVIYRPLEGEVLRNLLAGEADHDRLLETMARFLAELHQKGIYFRAIHFPNILVTPDGIFGLIDVLESYFQSRPLSALKRARNFKHMVRYAVDRDALSAFGLERFLTLYLDASGLSAEDRSSFRKKLKTVHPFYAE